MMSLMRTPLGRLDPRSSARRMGLPTTAGKEYSGKSASRQGCYRMLLCDGLEPAYARKIHPIAASSGRGRTKPHLT
jgi:hypothetical protein